MKTSDLIGNLATGLGALADPDSVEALADEIDRRIPIPGSPEHALLWHAGERRQHDRVRVELASGAELDAIGATYDAPRLPDESDSDYRRRIDEIAAP